MSYYDHSQSPVEFAYNNNGKNMRAINWNDIKDDK
ncbi:ribonucleoside-diphosphate reductase, partial [Lactobacillus crispatus]|nr:ribonucleoside-diphosphate reductase [Lactobacillus crispatus]MDT9618184.1 ribonucleoside-diphosphate reductase [Lactobacillus crispatus]